MSARIPTSYQEGFWAGMVYLQRCEGCTLCGEHEPRIAADRASSAAVDKDQPIPYVMRAAQEALDHLPKQQKLAAMEEIITRLNALCEVIEIEE